MCDRLSGRCGERRALRPNGATGAGRRCDGVDATAGRDPAALAEARAAVARAGDEAQLRVPRTPTEQLSVTHYFAVQGYDLVVGVGLDRRVAITPVARKFPHTRFLAARPGKVARALG